MLEIYYHRSTKGPALAEQVAKILAKFSNYRSQGKSLLSMAAQGTCHLVKHKLICGVAQNEISQDVWRLCAADVSSPVDAVGE